MSSTRLMGRPRRSWIFWFSAVLLLFFALDLPRHYQVDALNVNRRVYRQAVRLCSRNLSDALYMLCKDRGYNEPFSSSGEADVKHTTGPGLVEECCYNACSLEQLQQYCKPTGKQQQ